jgi:hypothetical protein
MSTFNRQPMWRWHGDVSVLNEAGSRAERHLCRPFANGGGKGCGGRWLARLMERKNAHLRLALLRLALIMPGCPGWTLHPASGSTQ